MTSECLQELLGLVLSFVARVLPREALSGSGDKMLQLWNQSPESNVATRCYATRVGLNAIVHESRNYVINFGLGRTSLDIVKKIKREHLRARIRQCGLQFLFHFIEMAKKRFSILARSSSAESILLAVKWGVPVIDS